MNEWAAFWIVMGVLSALVLWHEWGKDHG